MGHIHRHIQLDIEYSTFIQNKYCYDIFLNIFEIKGFSVIIVISRSKRRCDVVLT